MTILDWAKKYIEMGWSVIPVKNKVPQVNWTEYQSRYPTQEELKRWFGLQSNGIGIVTGKLSVLSVVDVDSYKAIPNVESSIAVKTPKGRHYYFSYNERLKNWVKPTGQGWDIRTEGGFVVAPPTSGYTWRNPWFKPSQLLSFPSHLISEKAKQISSFKPEGWIADALQNLQEGNRDDTFTRIIGRLNRDHYDADTINLLLAPYAKTCNFGIDTLNDKIQRILLDYPHRVKEEEGSDSLSEFLRDIPPINWICKPLISKGTIGFIAGLPETMKTWICADLAIEVARGGKWLGKYPVNKGRVLFIDQERWKGEVQRRFKALMNEKGLIAKDLEGNLILKSQTTTRIDLEESFNAFRQKLMDIRPDIVIVDSFATFHTKNENDRQDVQLVLERLKQLRTEFGCTILMIDHENKSVFDVQEGKPVMPNAFKIVGSVGKPAAAESIFVVRKLDEQNVMMYHVKSTIAPTIEHIKVRIQDTERGVKIS